MCAGVVPSNPQTTHPYPDRDPAPNPNPLRARPRRLSPDLLHHPSSRLSLSPDPVRLSPDLHHCRRLSLDRLRPKSTPASVSTSRSESPTVIRGEQQGDEFIAEVAAAVHTALRTRCGLSGRVLPPTAAVAPTFPHARPCAAPDLVLLPRRRQLSVSGILSAFASAKLVASPPRCVRQTGHLGTKQPSHAVQNGHVLPSKVARYLNPDPSWDKVRSYCHQLVSLVRYGRAPPFIQIQSIVQILCDFVAWISLQPVRLYHCLPIQV